MYLYSYDSELPFLLVSVLVPTGKVLSLLHGYHIPQLQVLLNLIGLSHLKISKFYQPST